MPTSGSTTDAPRPTQREDLVVRVTFWIPKTEYGWAATLIAGAVIAVVGYFVVGAPSFDAPVGSSAYIRDEQALAVIGIATLVGGTWIGTRLEQQRLVRAAMRASLEQDFAAYADRLVARQTAAVEVVRGHPWADEAMSRRDLARSQTAQIETAFDSLNPYFCLGFDSLTNFGFTSHAEIEEVRRLVQTAEFPHRWANPLFLRDLELLDSREDALVRIGLAFRHQDDAT